MTSWLLKHSHINWALADQAMVSGVNFLTGILLARFLGLEEFGVFTLVWMVVLFVNGMQIAVIISPMMSLAPRESELEVSTYLGAVLAQQIVFCVFSSLLIFVSVRICGVFFPQWQVQDLALPLASATFTFQVQDFIRRYFFTRNRPYAAFTNDAISYLGQLSLLVWLFKIMRLDSSGVLWVISGTSAVAVVFGVFGLEKIVWKWTLLRPVIVRNWRFSKWLTATVLLQWNSGNLFIIAAASMMGTPAAGALKAVQNIMGVLHILFNALENIVPVKASIIYAKGGQPLLDKYIKSVTKWGFLATFSFALLISVTPGLWLTLFYGQTYVGYGNLLRGYAILYLMTFFGVPFRIVLRTLEHTRPIFISYLLAAIFSFVLAYPLVKWFGLLGVISGLIFIQLVIQMWCFLAIKRGQRRVT
jgi:O-antigen/teichoic acid export membrane protein